MQALGFLHQIDQVSTHSQMIHISTETSSVVSQLRWIQQVTSTSVAQKNAHATAQNLDDDLLCRRSNVWRNESKGTNSRCHQANLLAVGPWLNNVQSSTMMVQILAHSTLLTRMDSATIRCGLHLIQSVFSVSLLGSLDFSGLWISPPTCWSWHSFLVPSTLCLF